MIELMMLRVKRVVELIIKNNPDLSSKLQDKYYSLLILLANNQLSVQDIKNFRTEILQYFRP